MPEGQETESGPTIQGQPTTKGFEGQAPGVRPAVNREGQHVADKDGDEYEGQDGDLSTIHPSYGSYADTQPASTSATVPQTLVKSTFKPSRTAARIAPGNPNRQGAFSRQTGEVQR